MPDIHDLNEALHGFVQSSGHGAQNAVAIGQALARLANTLPNLLTPMRQLEARFDELEEHYTRFARIGADVLAPSELHFARRVTEITKLAGVWKALGDSVKSGGFAYIVSLFTALTKSNQTLNDHLKEAVSLESKRAELTRSVLGVSEATGVAYDKVAQHAKALIGYGLENYSTWKENLKVITRMAEMMEISASAAGKLAAQLEVGLGVRFSGIADEITRIVENTALSGTEATEFANEYAQALKRFGGASTAEIRSALEVLSRYEDAIKRAGGVSGEFTKLITSFTDFKNAATAAVAQSQVGTRQALSVDNINRVAVAITGLVKSAQISGSSANLKLMADQLGLNIDMMDSLTKGLAAQAAETDRTLTTQARFDRQMKIASQSFNQLKSTLWSLTQDALLPTLQALNWGLSMVARAAQIVDQHPGFKSFLSGVGAIVVVGASIGAVIRSLSFLGPVLSGIGSVARTLLATPIGGSFIARAISAILPSFTGTTIAGIGAVIGPAIGPIIAAAAGIGMLVLIIKKIYELWTRKSADELRQEAFFRVQRQQDLDIEALRLNLKAAVEANDTSAMVEALYGVRDQQGRHKGGGLIDLMEDRYGLNRDDALRAVVKNEIQPLFANLRTTAASLTRYDEPRGAEASQRLEDRINELIKVVREVGAKAVIDVHTRRKEALEDAKQEAILRTNTMIGTQNAIPNSVTFKVPSLSPLTAP